MPAVLPSITSELQGKQAGSSLFPSIQSKKKLSIKEEQAGKLPLCLFLFVRY